MNASTGQVHNILVVDDETTVCDLLRRGLNEDNFIVNTLTSAKGVTDTVLECNPCLVILDVFMPDGDGMDVLKSIKAAAPNVPVVLMSGVDDPERRRAAGRLGACAFLAKPIDWSYLRNIANLCFFLKESHQGESHER